jgi:hypothetical protein
MQRIPFVVKDLMKMSFKKESSLENSILKIRKFRRKDTPFTKIVINKLHKELLINTLKHLGFKVLKKRMKKAEKSAQENYKKKEHIKFLSLNINHLTDQKEELEVLFKKNNQKLCVYRKLGECLNFL